jgi:hypothetical protein
MGGIAALDVFVVVSGAFRLLYVEIVLGHARRQIIHFAVTQHSHARLAFPANH